MSGLNFSSLKKRKYDVAIFSVKLYTANKECISEWKNKYHLFSRKCSSSYNLQNTFSFI